MPAAKNYAGKRFGRLFSEEFAGLRAGRRVYLCSCDCGNKTIVPAHRLAAGKTTSCGCRKKEVLSEYGKKYGIQPTHGMSKTPTHKSWMSMLDRCQLNYKAAGRYADRGITVCDRWLKFENFLADMGRRPVGTSLDRINVNGNYEPGNCRWATPKQQQRNRENTRYLVIDGKRRPLMDVADELGIKKSAAQYFFSTYKKLLLAYRDVQIMEA